MANIKKFVSVGRIYLICCWTFENVDKNVSWHSHVLQNRYLMVTSNAIEGCVLSRKKWCLAMRTSVFYFEKWLIWGRGDGAVVRALTFHHCGLGSILGPGVKCGLSFFLVLVLAPRVFLWVLWFFFLHKNQHFKFQFDLETVDRKSHLMDRELLNYYCYHHHHYYYQYHI